MTVSQPELARYPVGGVQFTVAPLPDAIRRVAQAARDMADGPVAPAGVGQAVHFANAYTIALASKDEQYRDLLNRPEAWVFTDGTPVTWFGRRFFPQIAADWQRVYGPDVMTGVLGGNQEGLRHYLLGGAPEVLDALCRAVDRDFPEAEVVGSESPPYRQLSAAEQAEQDDRIRQSGANIVWVGLGTPKQDGEVARLARDIPAVFCAVGAAFDFLAGSKPQAPVWMQRSGTEWLYRLASEPKRLGRRYLWGNPTFVATAWRERPR